MTKQNSVFGQLTSRKCSDCPIRYQAFCARCDRPEIELLESIKRYRNYNAGETVAMSGFEMPFIASVVRGSASLTQYMEDGRVQMVGLLLPSDFIGNPKRVTALHTVTAISDLQLCCFDRERFESLVGQMPSISERILEMKFDELDAAREWMMVLGRKTARERICSLLAMIARRDARAGARACKGCLEVDLLLTRSSLGDFLSLSMETVSRQLAALRDEGLIEFGAGRKMIIKDFQTFLNETGDDSDGGVIE